MLSLPGGKNGGWLKNHSSITFSGIDTGSHYLVHLMSDIQLETFDLHHTS